MASVDVLLLEPPYTSLSGPVEDQARIRRGSIIMLHPVDQEHEIPVLREASSRHESSLASVVLCLDRLNLDRALEVTLQAPQFGAAAVVMQLVPDRDGLRRQLTDPDLTPQAILQWLKLRGFVRDPLVLAEIEFMIRKGIEAKSLGALLTANGISPRSVARRFQTTQSGTANEWFRVLRAVARAIVVQREPGTSVASLAERFGCFDDAALRAEFREILGARPTDVRGYLGWKWLLYAGLWRAGLTALLSKSVRQLSMNTTRGYQQCDRRSARNEVQKG